MARLQLGLDRPEQPEAHLAVIARERDHEMDPPMGGGVDIAGERANPFHGTGLVHTPVMAMKQVGVGREELEHFRETAGGEAVVATDARALLKMDGRGEPVRFQHSVRNLKRFLKADRRAKAVPADLQKDLVGDIIVGGAEQLDEDLRKGARLSVNVDWHQSIGYGSGRDPALHAAAGLLDERGDQLAGILEAHRRVLAETNSAAAARAPGLELS